MSSLFSAFTQADGLFIASGFLGMIAHYMKKVAKKETASSLAGYFGKDNLPATITTFTAFFMAVVTALNSGIVTDQMGLWAVLYAGVTTGFAVDSGFNSGSSPDTPTAPISTPPTP